MFFVSILHSSQKTRESLLLGSEWVSKHFLHIEWPQTRVSGSLRYSKHDKQLKVESNCSTFRLFFYNILTNSFFNFSSFSIVSLSLETESFNFSYLLFSFATYSGNAFCISIRLIFVISKSLIFSFNSAFSFSCVLIYSLSFSMSSLEPWPSVSKSFSYFSKSFTFF